MKLLSLLITILGVTNIANAIVHELIEKNFEAIAMNPKKSTLVKFYAKWCSHCKDMEPEYDALSNSLESEKDIDIVQIDVDIHKSIGKKYGISSYPTLKLFKAGEKENPIDFKGERKSDSMYNFLKSHLNFKESTKNKKISKLVQLNDNTLEKYVYYKSRNAFVVATSDKSEKSREIGQLFKDLSSVYHGDFESILIGEINVDGDEPCDWIKAKYEITEYPKVFYFPFGNIEDPEIYEGDLNMQGFVQFVNNKVGLFRTVDGSVDKSVGTLPEVTDIIRKFVNSKLEDRYKIMKKVIAALKEVDKTRVGEDKVIIDKLTYYVKIANTFVNGPYDFVFKEKERLEKLLDTRIPNDTRDLIDKKLNVLEIFTPDPDSAFFEEGDEYIEKRNEEINKMKNDAQNAVPVSSIPGMSGISIKPSSDFNTRDEL
ncbi:unnamed protein product [[Candida] boidinii]|uniref:protein disulfide-isomerase n=1 Tax=Candida boidinii TaxID=5477 RepID=A0A9W6SWF5_CANBO|nr:hypothetical protein B5S30_g5690 [[Candida] boidinii]OWB84165.1 hypothetical protein B5S33_g2807 [[Candida] boidinii]GME68429.1 unnamed protein product [[Candida] boidinii]GMG09157.1 unnamed protein product [[Candida] boidinii]